MHKIDEYMAEMRRLHACVADGEVVRVGGVDVEASGFVMVRHDALQYRIRSISPKKSTYPADTEFGPFALTTKAKRRTFAHMAYEHMAKGKGKEQIPNQNKWRDPGTGKSGGGASHTQYCESFKKHMCKRSSEGAGGGAAKKSRIMDDFSFDDDNVLGPPPVQPTMDDCSLDDDNALGTPPVQPSMVFGSGAADASLGTADMSLGSPGGGGSAAAMEQTEDLADLLLGDTSLDELDKCDLDKLFADDLPAPDPAEVA
jgi:hypothetical protein